MPEAEKRAKKKTAQSKKKENQAAKKPGKKRKKQPVGNSIEKQAERPVDKPAAKAVEEAIGRSVDDPPDKAVDKPVKKPAEKQAKSPADKPAAEVVEEAIGEHTEDPPDKPVDIPVEKPAEKHAESPIDKPTAEVLGKTVGEPAEKPPDKPVDRPLGKLAAKPAERPAEKSSELLRTEKLAKIYGGRRVVNEISITVNHGEIVGLLGKNGAGKTTTFYMIVGLIHPDGGSVFFRGVDVTREPMFRRSRLGMGYLSQEPSVFRNLSVRDNIMAILETLPMDKTRRDRRLRVLLEELGIAHLAKQKAYTLSGGERRRLEISRALVTHPSFIMLDEPFSGVDPIAVNEVQNIIRELKSKGFGILVTDHNVRETLSIVDRAYIIDEGTVCSSGTSEFLINDPTARKLYLGELFTMNFSERRQT